MNNPAFLHLLLFWSVSLMCGSILVRLRLTVAAFYVVVFFLHYFALSLSDIVGFIFRILFTFASVYYCLQICNCDTGCGECGFVAKW